MKKFFYKDTSVDYPGYFFIRVDPESFFIESAKGSLHIMQARLFGITYPQYLRMCRDYFNAEIVGKDTMCPVAYFKNGNELDNLIENLNARANFIVWEREHPDFKEHAEYVKEKNPRFYAEVMKNVNHS